MTCSFVSPGRIRVNRIPQDPSPLFECNGLYFIAVFKGYHPLCGSRLAGVIGNKLRHKNEKALGESSADFSIGAFIAPESFINASRNMPTRKMNHFDGSKPDETHGAADLQARFDTMSQNHHPLSLWVSDDDAIMCIPIWRMEGYHIKCSDAPGAGCLPQKYYTKFHIPIDWNLWRLRDYLPCAHPKVIYIVSLVPAHPGARRLAGDVRSAR